jgi:hypothetical protein
MKLQSHAAGFTSPCRCHRCVIARRTTPTKLFTLPCPWCGERINIGDCKTRRRVRGETEYGHLYCGGLKPPASRCKVKSRWMSTQPRYLDPTANGVSPITEVSKAVEDRWVEAAVKKWRAKSPYCVLLSDVKLKEAHQRGGRNQSKEAKRRGGQNQDPWYKKKGGINSAATRWGTARI